MYTIIYCALWEVSKRLSNLLLQIKLSHYRHFEALVCADGSWKFSWIPNEKVSCRARRRPFSCHPSNWWQRYLVWKDSLLERGMLFVHSRTTSNHLVQPTCLWLGASSSQFWCCVGSDWSQQLSGLYPSISIVVNPMSHPTSNAPKTSWSVLFGSILMASCVPCFTDIYIPIVACFLLTLLYLPPQSRLW